MTKHKTNHNFRYPSDDPDYYPDIDPDYIEALDELDKEFPGVILNDTNYPNKKFSVFMFDPNLENYLAPNEDKIKNFRDYFLHLIPIIALSLFILILIIIPPLFKIIFLIICIITSKIFSYFFKDKFHL